MRDDKDDKDIQKLREDRYELVVSDIRVDDSSSTDEVVDKHCNRHEAVQVNSHVAINCIPDKNSSLSDNVVLDPVRFRQEDHASKAKGGLVETYDLEVDHEGVGEAKEFSTAMKV